MHNLLSVSLVFVCKKLEATPIIYHLYLINFVVFFLGYWLTSPKIYSLSYFSFTLFQAFYLRMIIDGMSFSDYAHH